MHGLNPLLGDIDASSGMILYRKLQIIFPNAFIAAFSLQHTGIQENFMLKNRMDQRILPIVRECIFVKCPFLIHFFKYFCHYYIPRKIGTFFDGADGILVIDPGHQISYLGFAMGGGSGEYVATKEEWVTPAPKSMPLTECGCIPLASLTAWEALFTHGKLEKGQIVVVNGASGGVGNSIVQLAKWKGATVIGIDHGSVKDNVMSLGADYFVDYTCQKLNDVYDGEVDLIINFSNAPESQIDEEMKQLKKGGTVVNGNAAMAQKMLRKMGGSQERGVTMNASDSADVNYVVFSVDYDTESLSKIVSIIDEGGLKPLITNRISVKDLKTAHETYLQGRNNGKILVIVDETLK